MEIANSYIGINKLSTIIILNIYLCLQVEATGSEPITKPSRFLVAVRKVMLSERLKTIREQHKREVDNAVKDLQSSYEQKQQEAFSELVCLN